MQPNKDTTIISPLTIFSWDIECLPENTEEFPDENKPGDVIKQIGVVLAKYGTKLMQKFIFTSSPCDQLEDITIIESGSEKEMLTKLCQFIKIVDPDIITGYNTWGFDDKFIWKKITMNNVDADSFSRINTIEPELKIKELSTSAVGNNEFRYIFFLVEKLLT